MFFHMTTFVTKGKAEIDKINNTGWLEISGCQRVLLEDLNFTFDIKHDPMNKSK